MIRAVSSFIARRASLSGALALAIVVGCGGCDDGANGASDPPPEDLPAFLEDAVERYGIASIAAGAIADGAVTWRGAAGLADVDTGRAATVESIYSIASCSKPVVGLAVALLMEDDPSIDLDADVDRWLDWPEPLIHPMYADTPVTLRQLLTHRSGIEIDGAADYETYPKPDPDQPLDAFLQATLSDPVYWLPSAPGEVYHYSNLGVALAALVVEKAAGVPFEDYCNARIFAPLGMDDTRWFYDELSAEQQARYAIPHDEDQVPYEVYGYNDWPSGQLRTTIDDLARFMIALSDGGQLDGAQALPSAAIERFHGLPMLIEAGPDDDGVMAYDHSGGETGVNAYFTYRADGRGWLYFINADIDDASGDALDDDLGSLLEATGGR